MAHTTLKRIGRLQLFIAASILFTTQSFALTIGSSAPDVIIGPSNGGYIKDGAAFKLNDLSGKLQVIWYVDPDEKNLNEYAQDQLRAKNFDLDKVGSVAIINFAATMVPNFILGGVIESSQEENKKTVYVKDLEKVMVKKWGLKDDSSNVVVLDKNLKVLYWFGGKLDKEETERMLDAITQNISL